MALALVLGGSAVFAAPALAEDGSTPTPTDTTVTDTVTATPDPTAAPGDTSTDTSPSSDPAPPALREDYLVTFADSSTEAERDAALAAADAVVVSSVPALSLVVVSLDVTGLDTLRADAHVVRVESDKTREVQAAPSDPSYADQWSLPQIGWDSVFGSTQPSGNATVAVLDTGVDVTGDLQGRVLEGASMLDLVADTADGNGHGTAMAGIVAAGVDNGAGIAGVGLDAVSVLPVKVLGADGTGQDSDIVEGVVYAADHGADVILMSFSNPGRSYALQAAVDYAWSKGAVIVAATGNEGSSMDTFPAGLAKVVGVSATNRSDELWTGSNYGADTFLAAPGVDIATGNGSVTGTSASAAVVAGSAAVLAADSSASNGVIVGRLARNADPAGTVDQTGNGRVNLARALADTSTDPVVPQGVAGNGGPVVGPYVAAGNSTVSGVVRSSAAGNPSIVGASITCTAGCNSVGQSTTSGVGGAYSFLFNFSGSSGTLTLVASAPGYTSDTKTVSVSNSINPTQNFMLTLSNTAPTATVSLSPSSPTTNQLLTATATRADDDGNTVTLTYVWKVNGTVVKTTPVSSSLTDTLDLGVIGNGNRGETVRVEVTPNDGIVNGATVDSSVTVANSAPTLTSVSISPASAGTNTLLTANPDGFGDVDGDSATYHYQWSKNGVDLAGATGATLDLAGLDNGGRGDVIAVAVFATDGNGGSSATRTSSLTVGNTAPTLTSVSVSPSSAGTDSLLTATPSGYSDADNDAAVYHYQWSKNGVDLAGATGATLDLAGLDNGGRGDVIAVAVHATDGNGGSSPTRTDSLTVGNTAPTLTAVTISSATPATDSVVTATPGGYADADGDSAVYHYVWSKNGSVIPGETDPTLDLALVENGDRGDDISVAVYATDGNGGTSPTRTDSVTVANSAPTADGDTGSTGEDTAVAVDVVSNDDDLDGDDLSVVPSSISSTNGSATLDADGRTIHFTPGANLNDGNVDVDGFTVLYRATDGDLESGWATLTISVSASNDAPTADGEGASTDEDTAVAVDVVANDSDVDDANSDLSVVGSSISSTNGSATLDADGRTIHFTPALNKNNGNVGPAGFTVSYKVSDGDLESNEATLTISVAAVNDAPAADDESESTDEDTSVAVDVVANDGDVDDANADLSVVETSISSTNGSATLDTDGRTINFTPDANLNDVNVDGDGFTVSYKVSDGDLESNEATLTIHVGEVNDAPTLAAIGNKSVDEQAELSFGAVGADQDLPADTLTYSLVGADQGAAIDPGTGVFTWTPTEAQGGADYGFTVRVSDGSASTSRDFTVTVNEVNVAPTLEAIADTDVDEQAELSFSAVGEDQDLPADTLTYSLVGADHGAAIDPGTGAFTWTPTEAQGGDDYDFTVQVSDGSLTATRSFTVTVNEVNDAPSAEDNTVPVVEDGTKAFATGDFGFSDPDDEPADALSSVVIASLPTEGTLRRGSDDVAAGDEVSKTDIESGMLTFTPAPNANGPGYTSFGFKVRDDGGTDHGGADLSVAKTMTLDVTEVNDAPAASGDTTTVAEDSGANTVDVLGNDSKGPANEAGQTLTVSSVTQPAHGSVSITNGGADVSYTPNGDYNGADSFTYTVTDDGTTNGGLDAKSDTATVTVTVTEVNDKPVAGADSATVAEDSGENTVDVLGDDSTGPGNESGQALTVSSVTQPAHGSVSITNGGADVSYTPNGDYNGADSFTYTVTDDGTTSGVLDAKSDTATVNVTVTEVNDAPVVTPGSAQTADEGSSVTVTATYTDVDGGGSEAYSIDWGDGSAPTTGAAAGGAISETHTYADNKTPNAAYNAVVTVTDAGTTNGAPDPESGSGTVPVTVNNVAPTVDTVTLGGLDPVTGKATLTATFTDPGTLDTFTGSGFAVSYLGGTVTPTNVVANASTHTMTADVTLPRGCITYSITANVVDKDGGTDAKSTTATSTDVYQATFKDPIRDDQRNIAKYGNVVPVKAVLTSSCSGAAVTTPELYLTIVEGAGAMVDDTALDSTNIVMESVSNADSGTKMRISSGMYIYNLSTKGLKSGTDYTLRVRSGAGGPIILRALLQPKK